MQGVRLCTQFFQCIFWVLVKYKVDKVRKVGEAKLHISLKIEQCGKVGKVGASFPTNPNI